MSGVIFRTPAARRDLVRIGRYLAQEGGLGLANRFVAAVEKALGRLARFPGLGSPYDHAPPELPDLRFAPAGRFRHHLLLYRPVDGGIQLVRVIHSAQDTADLFGDPA